MEKDEYNEDFEEETQEDTQTEEDNSEEKDWEAEAKKWRAIAERTKKKTEEKPKEETPDLPTESKSSRTPEEIEERVDLRMQGYSMEEIEFANRNRNGRSLSEAIKDPFVTAGIEAVRKQKQAEDKTPSPSGPAMKFNGKSFEEVIREGTPEEKQAAFEQKMGRRRTNQSE